jgi:catechol 2,3-dioxygenase-like lactoylglutathione lyase family enzyme
MLIPYPKWGKPFMIIHSSFRLAIFALLLTSLAHGAAEVKDKTNILDIPASHLNTIFHVGLWVENVDEMLEFLSEIMSFEIVLRAERQSGGERLILSDSRGQNIELLSDPKNVQAHPEFPLHPQGRVAGIAHISIWVEDVVTLKDNLTAKGYEVLGQVPADFADAYLSSDNKMYRILFVRGPNDITFELFEVKS